MGWAVFDGLKRALEAIKQNPGKLLQVPFLENAFSDEVGSLLRQQGYRATSRVNLWKMAAEELRERDPVKILKAMRHPLQPDVDLLVEAPEDSHRLSGLEIKVIRWHPSSFKKMVPRARLYTGLDQALSLTTYGFDYVWLWHIFVPSRAAYRQAFLTKGDQWAEQFEDGLIETASAYAGIAPTILDNFHLPIGYIPTGVFIDLAWFCCKNFAVVVNARSVILLTMHKRIT